MVKFSSLRINRLFGGLSSLPEMIIVLSHLWALTHMELLGSEVLELAILSHLLLIHLLRVHMLHEHHLLLLHQLLLVLNILSLIGTFLKIVMIGARSLDETLALRTQTACLLLRVFVLVPWYFVSLLLVSIGS